ncbi:hypothetical protein KIP88_41695 [Bradyrhizobium sp. SRL28]|uniref:hypothetical protein n=1 Tax=Bradyrhizobium sp. SRL28 TaxID=2836178 RepID=UPI001BDE18BF|nr:hypothetical protein [Bradyrhizobium sp. SRL28]MBT1516914.1 hypothetical protein [Bradyrhizobium sp. SRL28]
MRGSAAGDLGNLAGWAVETIPHPTLKADKGRSARVPDFTSPAMPVPAFVPELVLLGNGGSEPILTRNAMERAKRRHARGGRLVRVRFALPGVSFDDSMKAKTND